MSISLPSKQIYVLNVPDVVDVSAEFQYNFFTTDESVSDTGGVPTKFLKKKVGEIDSSFIQYATTRAPRFVKIRFSKPKLSEPGRLSTDSVQKRNSTITAQNGSLITDHLDKVVSEDSFALNDFVAMNFHDGEIDNKLYNFVSGSLAMNTLHQQGDQNVSAYKAASSYHAVLPKQIKPHFLFSSLTKMSTASGVRFHDKNGQRIFEQYFERLKNVSVNSQINSKLFFDITNRIIKDPNSQFSGDMHNAHKFAKKLLNNSKNLLSLNASDADYKTFVPFIDAKIMNTAHNNDQNGPVIVGYIVDKTEVSPDGTIIAHQPLIIENPNTDYIADFKVKYNSVYTYGVRTIALFNIPAFNEKDNNIAMLRVLISSSPQSKVYVQTIETIAPPAPSDVNFTWNYERVNPTTALHDHFTGKPLLNTGKPGSLLIHWTFPPNSQRDIKKFQVFRRKNIDEPFELLKVYDFDDSAVRMSDLENPHPNLVEHITSPCTFFYDDEFDKEKNSVRENSFIYAIAAIDAHGMTSNYSAQYQLWFNPFKNSLEKALISHTGAPKPYPNLYLEADLFVDTINVSGDNSKRFKLYFNPEYYHLYDDSNRITPMLATKQTGGKYQLQFINKDNQKSATLTVTIDDNLRLANKTLAFPNVRFGSRRLSTT